MIALYIALLLTFYVGYFLYEKRPASKRKYFNKTVRDLSFQIWDTEFKRFKTKEAREELRTEYDRRKSQLETLKAQMKLNDEKGDDDKTKLS
jgi:hypothetical protein